MKFFSKLLLALIICVSTMINNNLIRIDANYSENSESIKTFVKKVKNISENNFLLSTLSSDEYPAINKGNFAISEISSIRLSAFHSIDEIVYYLGAVLLLTINDDWSEFYIFLE